MGVYQSGQPIEIADNFTVDGVATDPTNITYTILGPDGVETIYTEVSPEVTSSGVGSWLLSLSPPSPPGTYYYDVDATGAVDASRAASFTVLPDVTTVAEPAAWAVPGPCTAWVDSQSVWECCGEPMTQTGEGTSIEECPVDMTQYAFEASQVLYELSGRKFSGHCQRTVVACETRCGCGFQVLSRGHVISSYWDSISGCWSCGCRSQIRLPGYPIREVLEVVVDGDVVSNTDYRLDERFLLTRTDGERWPSCNAIECDSEEAENTVTYTYGMDPPLVGIHAAAELACQFYKACSGEACDLPTGITRVTRQGIIIEKQAFASWAFQDGGWRTGLGLVDSFLSTANRAALIRRPTIYSPASTLRFARPIGS